MMGHQTAIDTLQKTAESLVTSEGNLLSNPDEIQETVGEKKRLSQMKIYKVAKYLDFPHRLFQMARKDFFLLTEFVLHPCVADDIVERYDNLSKSVSDRNTKLQITLTRSMSVQDGLDEMMGWMERVEASVKEKEQIPLDSASIGDMLSKEAVGFLFFPSSKQPNIYSLCFAFHTL